MPDLISADPANQPPSERLQNGVGMLSPPGQPTTIRGMLNLDSLVSYIYQALVEIVYTINGRLTLGLAQNHYQSGNLDGEWAVVDKTPKVANTEFAIPHSLARVPQGVLKMGANKACSVYNDDTTAAWTNTMIYLKCDEGDVVLKLIIV
jgi:hypothetical protein